MPWKSPQIWVAGDVVTASRLNNDVRTDMRRLNYRPGFMLHGLSSKTLTYLDVGAWHDTDIFDLTDSFRDEGAGDWQMNATGTGVIINQKGLWTFGASYYFTATTAYGGVWLGLHVDASVIAYNSLITSTVATSVPMHVQVKTSPYAVEAGQEVHPEFYLFEYSVVSPSNNPPQISSVATYSPNFWGHKIRELF